MNDEKTIDVIKQVTLGDLRNTGFTEIIGKAIEPYSVVIFYAPDDARGSGGSGTLVNYKGIKGILTASHVVAPFRNKRTIFLPCLLREGTIDIWEVAEAPFSQILTIDDLTLYETPEWLDEWSENGLDISLIQFEDRIFDEIVKQWQKQPLDLAGMRKKYFSQVAKYWAPQYKHNWTWTIAGTPRVIAGSLFENPQIKILRYTLIPKEAEKDYETIVREAIDELLTPIY